MRFFGIPLLTLLAIISLLFGHWETSVFCSLMAGLIAGADIAAV
jgi:hypothetical protein